MMKRLVECVTCAAVLLSAPAISMAQSREAESLRMVQGTITAVDRTGRTVTIRAPQGNMVTLEVPASATRFEKVDVGDSITATYYDHVSLRLKSAGEPVGRSDGGVDDDGEPEPCRVARKPSSG